MQRNLFNHMLLATAACALAACGGGGGGGGSGLVSVPTPAPTPTPSPTPTPGITGPVLIPGATTTQTFTTIGLFQNPPVAGLDSVDEIPFSVRYDADLGVYFLAGPGMPDERMELSRTSDGYYLYEHSGPMENIVHAFIDPAGKYRFTNYGTDNYLLGHFAFGVATLAGGVAVTGSASYLADVFGESATPFEYRVGGSASLNFDFSAGTLAGTFDPIAYDYYGGTARPLGRYSFVDTVYSAGSTNFSGGLRHDGNNLTGSFMGLFTGPAGEELMATWKTQFIDPKNGQVDGIFGVLIGRKPGGP